MTVFAPKNVTSYHSQRELKRGDKRRYGESKHRGRLIIVPRRRPAALRPSQDVLQPGFETSGWAYSGSQL
jgi:hypothetical protein